MIPNEKRCHYLAVTKLSALSRGITSNHSSNFSCLNCLHSIRTKTKLESHKKVCENKEFGMPCKKIIFEFTQYLQSNKGPCID